MTKPSLLDKIETFRGAAGAAKERGRGLKHFYKYHISAGFFFMGHNFGIYTCMKPFFASVIFCHIIFIIIIIKLCARKPLNNFHHN